MKKSNRKVLGLVSVVLMFTLVSTCLMSGTLAKYVTAIDGKDEARVAKWDVGTSFSFEMFSNTYETDDSTHSSSIVNSVAGEDSEKVFAPGTKGEARFEFAGVNEVATLIEVKVNKAEYIGDWFIEGDYLDNYYPIQFSLDNGPTGDLAALIDSLESLSDLSAPNQDIGARFGEHVINWEWTFEVNQENNILDTELGNRAANGEELRLELEIEITATQVD